MFSQFLVVVLSTVIFLGVIRAYIFVANFARKLESSLVRTATALSAFFALVGSAFGFGVLFERVGYSDEMLILIWVAFFVVSLWLGKALFLHGNRYSTLFDREP